MDFLRWPARCSVEEAAHIAELHDLPPGSSLYGCRGRDLQWVSLWVNGLPWGFFNRRSTDYHFMSCAMVHALPERTCRRPRATDFGGSRKPAAWAYRLPRAEAIFVPYGMRSYPHPPLWTNEVQP